MQPSAMPWRRVIHGIDVHFRPNVDSTQDDLRALIADGAPDLTMVSAGAQRAGRGRGGRRWASPPGNLYTSTLLRPQQGWSSPLHAAFVAALAVEETVSAFVADRAEVRIKWPNDVLVDGGKIAGVLLEAGNARATDGDDGAGFAVDWLALGVGINVAHRPETGLYPTTCLGDFGTQSVDAVLKRYCAALVTQLGNWRRDGFGAVKSQILDRMAGLGQIVTVGLGDKPADQVSGRFAGLDQNGALLLDTKSGRRVVTAGDVFLSNT